MVSMRHSINIPPFAKPSSPKPRARRFGQRKWLRGYEIPPNDSLQWTNQEIKAAEIQTCDTTDLFHFVKVTKVDPIYFDRSYYVAPD